MNQIVSMVQLRPADGTSAAIQAALSRADQHRIDAQEEMKRREAARGQLLLTGTTKEIDENEVDISRCATFLAQLEAFTEALQQPLKDAREAERVAVLQARWDALDYNGKVQAFDNWWGTEYEQHARAIAAGMQLEAEALACEREARILQAELVKAGRDVPAVKAPAFQVVGALREKSLGQMVKLPGMKGAPAVPYLTETVKKTRFVTKNDYDRFGKVVGSRTVEEGYDEIKSGWVREDTPIWWLRDE